MKKLLTAAAAFLLLGVLAAANAQSATLAPTSPQIFPTFKATVVDPFAACVGVGTSPTGINTPNTEPEAWLATNPARRRNLIGASQQDRWNDGGAKGLAAAFSVNDGVSWQNRALPFSTCAIPYFSPAACPIQPAPATPTPCTLPYDRASDPWVDVGPDGTAYTVSISFNALDNNNAVGAATSQDGGNSWAHATEIQHDTDADPTFPFNDKESVTADPLHAGTAYAVWDRLQLVACGPRGAGPHRPEIDDRVWLGEKYLAPPGGGRTPSTGAPASHAAADLNCFDGPAFFSKTTDGGRTWSTPRMIVGNSPNDSTIANQIVVDRVTGRLYDFYAYTAADNSSTIEVVFSDDGGLTWSSRQTINTNGAVGIHDPLTGEPARTGDGIPEAALDPRTGQPYVVWQDPRFNANGQDDILISTAAPHTGTTGTWSAPVPVDLPQDRAGFIPAIKVNDLGQVAVDYYSLRQPVTDPAVWPVERYIRISRPHGAGAAPPAFNRPYKVGGPFNLKAAPFADTRGYFVGDYEGMSVDYLGRAFHTFFAATNCDTTACTALGSTDGSVPPGLTYDPMDVYSSKVYDLGLP